MGNGLIPFDSIIIPLSAVLGLSLTVERILEFVKNLLEWVFGSDSVKKLTKLEKQIREVDKLEKAYKREKDLLEADEKVDASTKKREAILDKYRKLTDESDIPEKQKLKQDLNELEKDCEFDEQISTYLVLVKPATDPDDGTTIKALILQMFGFALGIILVHYSGIKLFNTFLNPFNQEIAPWTDFLFTGLLIGAGSGPMHTLVRFVTQRKIEVEEEKLSEKIERDITPEKNISAPEIISKPDVSFNDEWIDIPYKGGVDREILEGFHRRLEDPNLIVYHHTAMNSKSNFEDVIRVIKSRTDSKGNHWITGYNCVVLSSGSINPFCRWDRYGNHAAGKNKKSLGVAFNGNFENDPQVPFSNPNGRMGDIRPTESQLKAGARLVTLWTFLYSIDLDFDNSIIPHNKISSKTCPGSQFPYDEFKKLIELFRARWEHSDYIQEKIVEYKLKPYLYVKKET